jgi:hypothetical protein
LNTRQEQTVPADGEEPCQACLPSQRHSRNSTSSVRRGRQKCPCPARTRLRVSGVSRMLILRNAVRAQRKSRIAAKTCVQLPFTWRFVDSH